MKSHALAFGLVALALSACTTTEEANVAIQSRWIGQPADLFFSQYGPPVAQYDMASGGTIYTWRGGEKAQYVAATYAQPRPISGKTVTKVTDNGAGVVTTETSNSAYGLYQSPQVISPARVEELFCEVQITVDGAHRIQAIRASNDTTGEGLSRSRCAEVMGVQ